MDVGFRQAGQLLARAAKLGGNIDDLRATPSVLRAVPGRYGLYQGQIATKLRGFNHGVTVTAGLEAVFTTPSHGTAFDIAGKGVARPVSMIQATMLAAQLARARGLG